MRKRRTTLLGRSNTSRDKMYRAKRMGKRLVPHGKRKKTVYYEYRRNRADKNRRTRL